MRGAIANGEFLQAVREARGLTQEQLAALASVDAKTVRKAEQGKRVDVGTLARLALALGAELQGLIRSPKPEPDLPTSRREAVEQWQAAWDARDHDALLALYHDHIVLRLPGAPYIPFGGEFRGKEEVRRANELAWSTTQNFPQTAQHGSLIVSGDHVVRYGVCSLRLPDGREAGLSYVHIFTFEGRLIADHRVVYDTLTFREALQAPPPAQPEC